MLLISTEANLWRFMSATSPSMTCFVISLIGNQAPSMLSCNGVSGEGLAAMAQKPPLLEELNITMSANISSEGVIAIGKPCPLLSSFKLKKEWCSFSDDEPYEYHFGDWYSSYYGQ